MKKFTYKEPRLYKDKENKKWCIRYAIKYEGESEYNHLKEYGRLYYNQSLNLIPDLKKREKEFNLLRSAIELDLRDGIDKKQVSTVKKYVENRIKEVNKIHYDECVKLYLQVKGYVTPVLKKVQSKVTLTMFLNNQFRPFLVENNLLGDVRMITKSHLHQFMNFYYLHDDPKIKWGNNTFNTKRSYFGSFFSVLVDEELIDVNPVLAIKRKPKEKSQRFVIFTRDETKLLFDYLYENSYITYVMAKTIYYSYIRGSESTRMLVKDFDFSNNSILVRYEVAKTQNDKLDRHIGMHKPLKDVLIEYLSRYDYQPDWYLFGVDGKPATEQIDRHYYEELSDAVKVLAKLHSGLFNRPHLTYYGLKHTGVTHFIEDHLNTTNMLELLQFVQNQCRHERFTDTQIYWKQLGFSLSTTSKFLIS